jgi:Protein of unknown function (DUF3105)
MSKRVKKSTTRVASWWPVAAALLIIAGAIVLLVVHLNTVNAPPAPAPSVFAGEHYPSQGHEGHMPGDDVRFAHFHYSSDPPTSGYHREVMTSLLVSPVVLPKYIQVHLLEHGNVLLQYNCVMCPNVVSQLANIASEYNAKVLPPGTIAPTPEEVEAAEESGQAVIVAPYPGMAHKIALTAWTRLATLDDVNRADIVSFINQWLHNVDNMNQ